MLLLTWSRALHPMHTWYPNRFICRTDSVLDSTCKHLYELLQLYFGQLSDEIGYVHSMPCSRWHGDKKIRCRNIWSSISDTDRFAQWRHRNVRWWFFPHRPLFDRPLSSSFRINRCHIPQPSSSGTGCVATLHCRPWNIAHWRHFVGASMQYVIRILIQHHLHTIKFKILNTFYLTGF